MPQLMCHNERAFQRRFWNSMIFTTTIVCLLFLYFSFVYRGSINYPNEAERQAVSSPLNQCLEKCLTKECIQNANYFLGTIDPSVNPCDNFYKFSCGRYIEKSGKNQSVLSDMKTVMKNTIADMLENVHGPSNSSAVKMKTVFESCMSFTGSEVNVMQNLLEFVNRLGLGHWPYLSEDFHFISPTLEEVLAILETYDEYAFILFAAHKKQETSDPCLHVSHKVYRENNNSYVDGYEDIVKKTLRFYKMNESEINGVWESFKNIEKDIYIRGKRYYDNDLNFENETLSPTESTVSDTTSQTEAISNTTDQEHYYMPKIWNCIETESDNITFICNILKYFLIHTELENQFSKNSFSVQDPDYVFSLHSVLKNYTDRSIANFLVLKFFIKHVKEMNLYFRSMKYHLNKDRRGYSSFFAKVPQSKKEHCASFLAVAMAEPLAMHYISNIMAPDIRQDIKDMFQNYLMKALNYTLEQDWISEPIKKLLRDGFETMVLNPHEQYLSNFSQFLLEFHPSKENFLWNSLEYQRVKLKYILSSQFYRYNDDEMFVVNANFGHNIVLRYGILIPPAYHFGRPSVLNLGSIGYIILHEIGHGISMAIEDMSHKEDFNAKIYKEKSDCIKNQYSEYILEKINKKVKGVETYTENVADLISIEIIDKMLIELIADNNYIFEKTLPALPYSMQQLVFVSMAQLLCESRSIQLEEEQYNNDKHAAAYIRLNGMMRNSKLFGNTFNCKPETNMNPTKKCIFLE